MGRVLLMWLLICGSLIPAGFARSDDNPVGAAKVGAVGNPSSTFHSIFRIGSLSWGVIELKVEGYDVVNMGKISHAGYVRSVPESALLAFLGLGLMGVGATRRTKRRSAVHRQRTNQTVRQNGQ